MLAAGNDPNVATEDRSRPLHLAIEQQHLEIVMTLIQAGADVNSESARGWTPLVHAIDVESDSVWQKQQDEGKPSTSLTELLLQAGAEPNEEAFRLSKRYGNEQAMALLENFANRKDVTG